MVQKPDFAALRRDAEAAFEDPAERELVLRDLDQLERAIDRGDREIEAQRAALFARINPYQPASRARLAVILMLCTLIALVVAGVWLPQVLDSDWVSVGAAVVSVVGCAFAAVFALFALVRYPNHPFRRAGSTSAGLDSVQVDPLAEAEVYIAYGRAQQAIQILEGALKDEPQRKDLAAKLAELRKR